MKNIYKQLKIEYMNMENKGRYIAWYRENNEERRQKRI